MMHIIYSIAIVTQTILGFLNYNGIYNYIFSLISSILTFVLNGIFVGLF